MSDNQDKLQQRFEQLPDAEPPLGLDTRIKAQARAHSEERHSKKSNRKRWKTGLATVACAGLAFVIARPLLETPSSQRIELESAIQAEPHAADFTDLNEGIQPASVPLPATQKSSAAQRISNGGGARLERLAEPIHKAGPQLMKRPIAAPAAAIEATKESESTLQSMQIADESVPELQYLLKQLVKYRVSQEQEKVDDVEALIEEHYPEHELE